MYSARICAPESVEPCFRAESKELGDRASYTVRKTKGKSVFLIKAKDPVALRAEFNSIMKMLTVLEKVRRL